MPILIGKKKQTYFEHFKNSQQDNMICLENYTNIWWKFKVSSVIQFFATPEKQNQFCRN